MDTETIYLQMEQDFEALAKEHEAAANNEHTWALGCNNPDWVSDYAKQEAIHRELAKMYLKMKEDILAFIETYDEE